MLVRWAQRQLVHAYVFIVTLTALKATWCRDFDDAHTCSSPAANSRQSTNAKHAYLLEEDHRVFDHSFFGISPKEAEGMDPQQRLLLETVYEGIESAGYSMQQLKGSTTAVYVGMMNSDYTHLLFSDPENIPLYTASGIALSILANRVSYFFDWRGPSMSIDTACSSSMVALHQAVQALRSSEAKMAVVAGVNLLLGPEMFIAESKVRHCYFMGI